MKIAFTRHAKGKFRKFAEVGAFFSEQDVIKVIESPEHTDKVSDSPNTIVSRTTDEKHVLRVVFKVEDDIIIVITFYPAQRGRYYEA